METTRQPTLRVLDDGTIDLTEEWEEQQTAPPSTGAVPAIPMRRLSDFLSARPIYRRLESVVVLSIDVGTKNNMLLKVRVHLNNLDSDKHTCELISYTPFAIKGKNREERYRDMWMFADSSGLFADTHVVLVEDAWLGKTLEFAGVWFNIGIGYGCYSHFVSPRETKKHFDISTGKHHTNKVLAVAKYKLLEQTYRNTTRTLQPQLLSVRMKALDHYADALLNLLTWMDVQWMWPRKLADLTTRCDPTIPPAVLTCRGVPIPNPKKKKQKTAAAIGTLVTVAVAELEEEEDVYSSSEDETDGEVVELEQVQEQRGTKRFRPLFE
jgi:hypothetical protein